jgi:adenosylcobinamide-phosphate synthase
VVWMGRFQVGLRRFAPAAPAGAFVFGLLMALAGPLVFGLGAWWMLSALALGIAPLRIAAGIYLLKSAFAVRGLGKAALDVERALGENDLPAARHALRSLVSRDTSQLPPHGLAGAAIESVAENASDSVVAPLFYFAIAGIPGALAYRAINTLDAMIGYRGGDTEWLGKAAARLDDLANLVPARITALLLAMASRAGGGSAGRAMAVWMRDRRETESPNAGRPMAAMAGALGVELAKVGAYRLGAGLRSPEARDVGRAVRIFAVATGLAFALIAALSLLAA